MFINKLSVTLFNRHPTHFLSALSRTATIGNGALFYTIPTDVEQSEIPEVRDAVKETQSEDKAARKVVQEAEKAGVLATNKAEREAIAANAEAKRRQHQNNAIGHLRNAEKFVVGENRIVILLEIAQRYRDSENCDEAAIYFYLAADITANGSDGPLTITQFDNLIVEVALDPGIYTGYPADWWVLADTPFGWYYYDLNNWRWGQSVTYQGGLSDLAPHEVLNTSGLSTGNYIFYFGVDGKKDGKITNSSLYYDSVDVTIEP